MDIWKVVLFVLIAQTLDDPSFNDNGLMPRFFRLKALRTALEEYFSNAFAPEIINAFNIVKESSAAVEIISKSVNAGAQTKKQTTRTESTFQNNLQFIQRNFEAALSDLRLKSNFILFIDGIDIRPANVGYTDYLDCIKGLANAIWSLNNDFFPAIKDSKGRMKVVLLVRPDIFASLGLQNQNTKIRDNAVILDWRTNYEWYRNSELFSLADRLLGHGQSESQPQGKYWDYYFPYNMVHQETGAETDSSFISFLRFSFWRPRDIVTMLKILQEIFIEQARPITDVFRKSDFDSPIFRRRYAEYLLGEIKDHLSFYHTDQEYEIFLSFFEFLRGQSKFSYKEYCQAFAKFRTFVHKNKHIKPTFIETPDTFLQFLYDLNILSYSEMQGGQRIRKWCFRERTYSNISPKVKPQEECEIHYGLAKALNLGKRLSPRSSG